MTLNRRQVVGLLTVTAASSQVGSAQTPSAAPQRADQLLQAARLERQRDAQRVAAVPLPQTTEPAFHFRA